MPLFKKWLEEFPFRPIPNSDDSFQQVENVSTGLALTRRHPRDSSARLHRFRVESDAVSWGRAPSVGCLRPPWKRPPSRKTTIHTQRLHKPSVRNLVFSLTIHRNVIVPMRKSRRRLTHSRPVDFRKAVIRLFNDYFSTCNGISRN